jgi:N-acetylmuramoyl-L-alanine amidase
LQRLLLSALFFLSLTATTLAAGTLAFNRVDTKNDDLTLGFTAPVIYRAERFHNPDRLTVNFYSVKVDYLLKNVAKLKASWLDHAEAKAILGDSARLNLYLRGDINLNLYGNPPTSKILISLKNYSDKDLKGLDEESIHLADGDLAPKSDGSSNGNPPSPTTANPPVGTPPSNNPAPSASDILVQRLNFENGGDICRLMADLTSPVRPRAFLLDHDPANLRLVLDLPGAKINPPNQTIDVPSNPLVSRIRTGVFDLSVARVVLDLNRRVDFTLSRDKDDSHLVLALGVPGSSLPPNSDFSSIASTATGDGSAPSNGAFGGNEPSLESGGLAGKIIVLDPGHGGHDSGATGFGLKEKDIALDIAKRLATLLTNAGASVTLTRTDDRYIELPDRPAVANRLGADAFVSIHLNSTGSARNVWSGTETYYHFQDPICREFAKQVETALVTANGLPNRGARSDSTVSKRIGFSVLRNAQVPAILVENGFINNANDSAKFRNPDFRQRCAEGIMAGMRAFFDERASTAQGSSGQ